MYQTYYTPGAGEHRKKGRLNDVPLQAVEKAKGFFDSLRAARDIRAALCAVAVKNPLSAFFVENCGECSGVKRELAIYPNAL